MFVATGKSNTNEDTGDMLTQLNRELQALPEGERTDAAKNDIFTKAFGTDGRGRVKCMGKGPSKTSLREIASASVSSQVELVRLDFERRIEAIEQERQREREAIEQERQREKEEMKHQFQLQREEMLSQLQFFMSNLDPSLLRESAFTTSARPPSSATDGSPGVGSSTLPVSQVDHEDDVDLDRP